eukprot:gene17774-21171_t
MCIANSTPTNCEETLPSFVVVHPSKAIELTDVGAVKVSPRSSLQSVLKDNVSKYTVHQFARCAVAVRCAQPTVHASTYVTRSSVTVVFGQLSNSDVLKRKNSLDPHCSDAEVVYHLHTATKYGFLTTLHGNFMIVHYDEEVDSVLAANDKGCTYGLKQGQDGTGGLLVTDEDLGPSYKISE